MSTVASVNTATGIYDSLNGKKAVVSDAQKTQDRFLTLLIQQMKSQDPLNPQDSSQMTSQLAQINTVSGIDKLNSTMDTLASSFTSGQSMQGASLIGRSVLSTGNVVQYDGNNKVSAEVDVPNGSSNVLVDIYDSNNNKVDEISIAADKSGRQVVDWDGTDSTGKALPAGAYKISAVAKGTDNSIAPLTTYTYTKVQSVAITPTGVQLRLSDDRSMAFSDVTQIL